MKISIPELEARIDQQHDKLNKMRQILRLLDDTYDDKTCISRRKMVSLSKAHIKNLETCISSINKRIDDYRSSCNHDWDDITMDHYDNHSVYKCKKCHSYTRKY